MSIATAPASKPISDMKNQLQMIEAAMLRGERVKAVFDMKDGETGFVGITTKRVTAYDKTFLSSLCTAGADCRWPHLLGRAHATGEVSSAHRNVHRAAARQRRIARPTLSRGRNASLSQISYVLHLPRSHAST
jgi:hypothetical protein